MSEFDPSRPAMVHEQLNGHLIPWSTEDLERYSKYAEPEAEGVIWWEGFLLDGWCEPE
jgi:hypothetical protein